MALLTPAGIGINILGTHGTTGTRTGPDAAPTIRLCFLPRPGIFRSRDELGDADTVVPLELVQGEKTIRLSTKHITTLPFLHSDGHSPNDRTGFDLPSRGNTSSTPAVPGKSGFSFRAKLSKGKPVFADFALPYRLPDNYLLTPAAGSTLSENEADKPRVWSGWRFGASVTAKSRSSASP